MSWFANLNSALSSALHLSSFIAAEPQMQMTRCSTAGPWPSVFKSYNALVFYVHLLHISKLSWKVYSRVVCDSTIYQARQVGMAAVQMACGLQTPEVLQEPEIYRTGVGDTLNLIESGPEVESSRPRWQRHGRLRIGIERVNPAGLE